MKRSMQIKVLIWAHVILMVGAYNMYPFLTESTYHLFFKVVSVAWMLPALALLKLTYTTNARCAGIALIGLSLNNVLDEFFFNPSAIELNEIMIAFVVILWIVRDSFTSYGKSE